MIPTNVLNVAPIITFYAVEKILNLQSDRSPY